MPVTKADRQQVAQSRLNNPCATLEQIGIKYNITRERVRQILSEDGLPTKRLYQQYKCRNCGKSLSGWQRYSRGLFCNRKCWHEYTYIKFACDECGELKERNVKGWLWQVKHHPLRTGEHIFCSKICQGRWLGKNYGGGRNIRGGLK